MGGSAHERRAADVDILDRIFQRAARFGDRLAKGIEIDDHEIDCRNTVLGQRRRMLQRIAARKNATMHLGMQRLHPAVQHFGKTGVVADFGNGESGMGERFRGASGGEQSHSQRGEAARKVDQAAFVRNGKQRLRDGCGHR